MREAHRLLLSEFLEGHPQEAARLLEGLASADAAAILGQSSAPFAADVLEQTSPFFAIECLEAMDREGAQKLFAELKVEISENLLRRMSPEVRESFLESLDPERQRLLRLLLDYPEDTAGALMDPQVAALPEDITAEEAIKRIRRAPESLYYYLYVVNREQKLIGVLDLKELMLARPDALLRSVMLRDVIRLDASANLPSVREHPGWRELDAMPVVNEKEVLVGVLRHRLLRRKGGDWTAGQGAQQGWEALFALGELYWAGMCGILGGSLAAEGKQQTTAEEKEEQHGT